MKNIGEQAKEFRLKKGWNTKQMALAVGTSRQNIESLEDKGDRTPRYLPKLAALMGVTVDDLIYGRYQSDKTHREIERPAPGGSTHMASELAKLFDRIPDDEAHYIIRKEVDQACTEVILKALRSIREAPQTGPAPTPEQAPSRRLEIQRE